MQNLSKILYLLTTAFNISHLIECHIGRCAIRNHTSCLEFNWLYASSWWQQDIGTLSLFSILLAFCERNPLVTGGLPYKWPLMQGCDASREVILSRLLNNESNCHDAHVTSLLLLWRHNDRNSVSNHRRRYCLLNRLFIRRSKKTSKHASLAFVRGIHRWPVNYLQKEPVTRKMFSFDDVIIVLYLLTHISGFYSIHTRLYKIGSACLETTTETQIH